MYAGIPPVYDGFAPYSAGRSRFPASPAPAFGSSCDTPLRMTPSGAADGAAAGAAADGGGSDAMESEALLLLAVSEVLGVEIVDDVKAEPALARRLSVRSRISLFFSRADCSTRHLSSRAAELFSHLASLEASA